MLIRNATIISMDPNVGDLQRGDVLIRRKQDHRRLHQIAIAGFIDTHAHTWESLLRANWFLAQYFAVVRVVIGGPYTPEDSYVANPHGAR